MEFSDFEYRKPYEKQVIQKNLTFQSGKNKELFKKLKTILPTVYPQYLPNNQKFKSKRPSYQDKELINQELQKIYFLLTPVQLTVCPQIEIEHCQNNRIIVSQQINNQAKIIQSHHLIKNKNNNSDKNLVVSSKVDKELFPVVSEPILIKLLQTLYCQNSLKIQSYLLVTLLENKQTKVKILNSLIFILRNPIVANNNKDTMILVDHKRGQQQIPIDERQIKLKVLDIIHTAIKILLYEDQNFINQKITYQMVNDVLLDPRQQFLACEFATKQHHNPLFELLLESLKLESSLSHSLINIIAASKNTVQIPKIIFEQIVQNLLYKDVSDQFIQQLQCFATNPTLKDIFYLKTNGYLTIDFQRHGRILKYEFAQPANFRQIHFKILNGFKNQYSEFLNNIYTCYTVQELIQLKELLKFKIIHANVIKDLISNKRDITNQPIFKVFKIPSLFNFRVKKQFFFGNLLNQQGNYHYKRINHKRNQSLSLTYEMFNKLTQNQLKSHMSVQYAQQFGNDASGLTKQWFEEVSQQIVQPSELLFSLSSSKDTYYPSSKSDAKPNYLDYFKFVGRFVGKALRQKCLIDIRFTRFFSKLVLNQQISYKDMENFDYQQFQGLESLLKDPVDQKDLQLFFDQTIEKFDKFQTIELIPNGSNIPVNEQNKHDFVRLRSNFLMQKVIQPQILAFKNGLFEVIPQKLLQIFTAEEFEFLLAGVPTIDIFDFKRNTEYIDYTSASPVIIWFWQLVSEYDQQDLAKLIVFITGSSKIPSGGFRELRGMGGIQRIKIKKHGRKDHLPQSHTCFNMLDLPEYQSKEELKSKLEITLNFAFIGYGLEGR